jgi:hypothetical protein
MERRASELQEKLTELLIEAAEVSVALDRAKGTIQGVPHYSVIELRAHELGQQLSRQIQRRHLDAMITQQAPRGACPGCGTYCQLEPAKRRVTSIDGAVTLPELRGSCPRCHRAFFPSPGAARLRRARTDTGSGSSADSDGG